MSSISSAIGAPKSKVDEMLNQSEDLGSALWSNSKFKDFQMVIGDRALDVNKCVLAARSPVFAAMLTSGMTETTLGQLKIQDFDYDTVLEAIKYCYSSKFSFRFSISAASFWDLLKFGHKYDIEHLESACLHQIKVYKRYFNNSDDEIEFYVNPADGMLDYDQIIAQILNKELESDPCPYPALGDGLLAQHDSFKDLKIICEDDGTEFSVHKFILAFRSPIFAQIFDKMAQDGDTSGQLKITRVKPIVVENAIRFFYTRTIPEEAFQKNPDLLLGLLEFADKFKVQDLVSFCLQKIDQYKNALDKEIVYTYIQTSGNFESKKIPRFILGIFGTLGFDPFDFKKASEESYWN